MTTVFANNQPMTAVGGTDSVIWTDPVPLGDADRATAIFVVHYLWATGGGSPGATLEYVGEVSNDGVSWLDSDSQGAASGAVPPIPSTESELGAFLRYRFTLHVDSGDLAGVYRFRGAPRSRESRRGSALPGRGRVPRFVGPACHDVRSVRWRGPTGSRVRAVGRRRPAQDRKSPSAGGRGERRRDGARVSAQPDEAQGAPPVARAPAQRLRDVARVGEPQDADRVIAQRRHRTLRGLRAGNSIRPSPTRGSSSSRHARTRSASFGRRQPNARHTAAAAPPRVPLPRRLVIARIRVVAAS